MGGTAWAASVPWPMDIGHWTVPLRRLQCTTDTRSIYIYRMARNSSRCRRGDQCSVPQAMPPRQPVQCTTPPAPIGNRFRLPQPDVTVSGRPAVPRTAEWLSRLPSAECRQLSCDGDNSQCRYQSYRRQIGNMGPQVREEVIIVICQLR